MLDGTKLIWEPNSYQTHWAMLSEGTILLGFGIHGLAFGSPVLLLGRARAGKQVGSWVSWDGSFLSFFLSF